MKAYILLAEGFETIEALTPVDILRRCGVETVTVSASDSHRVTSSHGVAVALQDDRILPLKHGLFDHDAIALKNTLGQVTLKSDKGHRAVRVTYPDMPYLGLWHPPFTESPFLCIEPWTMLASRKGIIEDLATHPDILHLAPGKTYENTWMIECI